MKIGVVFPQSEIGADRGAVRAYAEGVEAAGFAHLLVYDHVVGADTSVHQGWRGPYDIETTFHEPFVLFGYLAAVTSLELVSGIVILPQRQTVLVAKQAAEVDILTGGKLRLGVGIGWNPVEYEALGQDFSTRGRRLTEQVELMRRLWTDRSVSFDGEFDTITGAGLAPMPVQQPIPVWIGGTAEAALRRAGAIADGWFPQVPPGPRLDESLGWVREGAEAAGRDPSTLEMEGRVNYRPDDLDKVVDHVGRWRDAGATHVSINTMGAGLASVDAHLDALGRVLAATR